MDGRVDGAGVGEDRTCGQESLVVKADVSLREFLLSLFDGANTFNKAFRDQECTGYD